MSTLDYEHQVIQTLREKGWDVKGKTLYSPKASMKYIPEEEMDMAMEIMERFEYAWGGVSC